MVITREIRDEIRNSVSTSINSVLKEEAFIKLLVEKVSDSLTKTLGEKIGELEQKINETNKKCIENSTVIEELKEETAALKSENEYLLRKSSLTGFQEFKEIVLENDIDIMLLSETWLGPDDHSVVVDIPGYTLFRKDRVGRGGGVGAYVKVSVSMKILQTLKKVIPRLIQTQYGEVQHLLNLWKGEEELNVWKKRKLSQSLGGSVE
ncbi:hypothetical protein JTB14_011145 [Gonioctena quinquepunctata]|nr:hypothetical protein JTB14_011145 [Gonioctena quinquepunctata]